MGNLHLVTGHAGTPHVTAADHASLHAALFGEREYVLSRGNKMKCTIISNNKIRIKDGDLLMQGRHIRLDEGSYVDLAVANGQQGKVRNDLVVARYSKDSVTGIEDCNLVVIKGTASTSKAKDPTYTAASIIRDNVLLAEMPLYRIRIVNLSIEKIVPLFEVLPTVDEQYHNIATDVTEALKTKIATVTLSASRWVDKAQTVSVSGVTENTLVMVAPGADSHDIYEEADIRCVAQGEETLTFSCEDVPKVDILVNVAINGMGIGADGEEEGTVLYTEQDLTEEQKAQARKNIGAVAQDEVKKELPTVTADDNGKVLKVVGGAWKVAEEDEETKELPTVTTDDNNKVLQVVNGVWAAVSVADSSIATFIDDYINSALEGDY